MGCFFCELLYNVCICYYLNIIFFAIFSFVHFSIPSGQGHFLVYFCANMERRDMVPLFFIARKRDFHIGFELTVDFFTGQTHKLPYTLV